jgi:hypothetical protein
MFGSYAGLCFGGLLYSVHQVTQSRLGEMTTPDVGQRHRNIAIADTRTIATDNVDRGDRTDQRVKGLFLVQGVDEFTCEILGRP